MMGSRGGNSIEGTPLPSPLPAGAGRGDRKLRRAKTLQELEMRPTSQRANESGKTGLLLSALLDAVEIRRGAEIERAAGNGGR
jgi:hypothetical protein